MADAPAPGIPDGAAAGGLPDEEVRALIGRLDTLLGQIEEATGPVAETAIEAVEALTEVYGTALARVMALASSAPEVVSSLAGDELLHHLLILHGIHPQPVGERIARALDGVRPYIRSHGGDVELTAIDGDVARIRLSGSCQGCASSAATLEHAVTDAVLTVAPELARVEAEPAPQQQHSPAVIPVESLLRKPATLTRAGSEPT
ncbi:MAG TPA: NifU family protein [Streptosporangiaceae bacterium]|jgi:Fe-S cluster biogenesis protein NfuA|nr:NifU family protein [Streptosporangiaceae bacterium]